MRRPSFAIEKTIDGPVAGLDEAGRGPLAGPVVAAAVIFHTMPSRRALYVSKFGERMRGNGAKLALKCLGMKKRRNELRSDLFAVPQRAGQRMKPF